MNVTKCDVCSFVMLPGKGGFSSVIDGNSLDICIECLECFGAVATPESLHKLVIKALQDRATNLGRVITPGPVIAED